MSKIRQYSSTFELTRGFLIALLTSGFIYLDHWGFSHPLLNTILALTSLYLLLQENKRVWFFSGFFIGLFWFWWILLSFKHYGFLWAIPIGLIIISVTYGLLFWLAAYITEKIPAFLGADALASAKYISISRAASKEIHFDKASLPKMPTTHYPLPTLILKALFLLTVSYIHPFGFDWFKPELLFIESYLGIQKWQFAFILISLILTIWKRQPLFLFLVLFTYQPTPSTSSKIPDTIQIVTTHTSVKNKWEKSLHKQQFNAVFTKIDQAIDTNKRLIILPESVFPVFLNRSPEIFEKLEARSKQISIVTGGLYWDGKVPRNSTYIFTKNRIQVANKVVLVPFGESNPLPDWLSKWVNKIFYDGAIDYKASKEVSDYKIDAQTYRNAICYEATSEKLYEGNPKKMIVLSNNGWFTPSIEPTLQKLLLQYYSKKYHTTIYHSANMSPSYVIEEGVASKVLNEK